MLSFQQLHTHTCAELVGMCKELGLPHSGRRKHVLVQALLDYQQNNGGIPVPVLARNSFRSHNAAAARYQQQQQQALLHHQQQSDQILQQTPPPELINSPLIPRASGGLTLANGHLYIRKPELCCGASLLHEGSSPANGSIATSMNLPLQKQMPGHPVPGPPAIVAAGGHYGPINGPGFPPPQTNTAAVGGTVGGHSAAQHTAPATASLGSCPATSTTSSNIGGGGQGPFRRCMCNGTAGGGSSSKSRVSLAKSLKCKMCGSLSHMSCYPDATGGAVAQTFVCSTCRVKRMDPFYPVEEVLWETRLEASHYNVDINSYVLRKWRTEGKEVIVRCMQLDQPLLYQTWPKSIQIAINGRTEETVAAPSWEHKRRDMPIVITQYLKNGKNKVELWWTNYDEPKPFYLAIVLCSYSSPEALAKTLELRSHVGEAEARRRVLSIVTNKNGTSASGQQDEDDDVTCMEVTRRIKLLCPITFTRITVPCRGSSCMHLQCFDLWGFLLVTRNTKAFNTRWKCPECQLYVRPDELVIDDFVFKILKNTPDDATVIELEADGSYRVVSEQELKEESKRAEAQRLRAAGACRVKRPIDEDAISAKAGDVAVRQEDEPTKKAFEVVEMLSSSEDEEEDMPVETGSCAAAVAPQRSEATAASTVPAAALAPGPTVGTITTSASGAPAAAVVTGAGGSAITRPTNADTPTRAEIPSPAPSSTVPIAKGGGGLRPALVSSLRSAAAAASAAGPGGLLFSSAATVAAHQQQQQHKEPAATTHQRTLTFSPDDDAEEGEDDEGDTPIRGGRFYKRLRRTALSPASSTASPAPVEDLAPGFSQTQQQRQGITEVCTSEAPCANGAAVATSPGSSSLRRRMSARAAARAASASAATGSAGESAQSTFPKAASTNATAALASERVQGKQISSVEEGGGDNIVIISSDEEEEAVSTSLTPIVTPQQQRRQLRRQQEQERRRLREEQQQEQRELVAQAIAAARQHGRRKEDQSDKNAAAVGKDQQNTTSFPQIDTLTLVSSPAITEAGAPAVLLGNLQRLKFPDTTTHPPDAPVERSVPQDSAHSEADVGRKAAGLLQLLVQRRRQELDQRETPHTHEIQDQQEQQNFPLHTVTSLAGSDNERRPRYAAPSVWQTLDRGLAENSSELSQTVQGNSSSSSSTSNSFPWPLGDVTSSTAGSGGQRLTELSVAGGDAAAGRPAGQPGAVVTSHPIADHVSGGTATPPAVDNVGRYHSSALASESSGYEQQELSCRLHNAIPAVAGDATDLFLARSSIPSAGFPASAPPPYAFPCAASQVPRNASLAEMAAGAPPFILGDNRSADGRDNTNDNSFGSRSDVRAPPTNKFYYFGSPSSVHMINQQMVQQEPMPSPVLHPQQQQPFLERRQPPSLQGYDQQLRPCRGPEVAVLPACGNAPDNICSISGEPRSSSSYEMYPPSLYNHQQPQRPQQILEELQQQVQEVMQESVQLQQSQHMKDPQRVQHQQRGDQHMLHRLQEQRSRLHLNSETADHHAETTEQQAHRRDYPTNMMDIRENQEISRVDARNKPGGTSVEAGLHRSSDSDSVSSRRRFSASRKASRSNSMEYTDTTGDGGFTAKDNEEYISERRRQQPSPSAQQAPHETMFYRPDAAVAPTREGVERHLPSSRMGVSRDDVRGSQASLREDMHKQSHLPVEDEPSQRRQRQQHRRGTADSVPSGNGTSAGHQHPLLWKAPAFPSAISEAKGTSFAPATNSQVTWPPGASATAAPVRVPYNPVTPSATTEQKLVSAGDATISADAVGAVSVNSAAARGIGSILPSAAGGKQGAPPSTRRGPRMSLPPRNSIAGLNTGPGGQLKSTAFIEGDRNISCAPVAGGASSSASLGPGVSSAMIGISAPPLPAVSASYQSKKQPPVTTRSAINTLTAPGAPATLPSMANTAGSATTSHPKSPARRLLVPPVPPPLPSRSMRYAASAGSTGHDDRGNSGATTKCGQSTSAATATSLPENSTQTSKSSASSGQCDQNGKTSSRLPVEPAVSTGSSASHALTDAPPVPAPAAPAAAAIRAAPVAPRPAAAAGHSGATAASDMTGSEAALKGTHSGTSAAATSRRPSDDDRNSAGVADEVSSAAEPEQKKNGSIDSSSRENTCSADNRHCDSAREANAASSAPPPSVMNPSPASAATRDSTASAVPVLQERPYSDVRIGTSSQSSRRSSRESGDQGEPSNNRQSSTSVSVVADSHTVDGSGTQSRATEALSHAECPSVSSAPPPLATEFSRENSQQETGQSVTCISTHRNWYLQRQDKDLHGQQHAGVERETSAAHHNDLRGACAQTSSLPAASNDYVGKVGLENDLGPPTGMEILPQIAEPVKNATEAGSQTTDITEKAASGTAAADRPLPVPTQAPGRRFRMTVSRAHQSPTHGLPPPAAFFSTSDSGASPRSHSLPREHEGEVTTDKLCGAAGAGAETGGIDNGSVVTHSSRGLQKGVESNSISWPRTTSMYTPAPVSSSFHASSSFPPKNEAVVLETAVGAKDSTGPSLEAAVVLPLCQNNTSVVREAASTLSATHAAFTWGDATLSNSCDEACAASSPSLCAAGERAVSTMDSQQKQSPITNAMAGKAFEPQFIPGITNEEENLEPQATSGTREPIFGNNNIT